MAKQNTNYQPSKNGKGGRNNFKGNSNKGKNYSNKGKGKMPESDDNVSDRSYRKGDINNPTYYYEDANVLGQVMNFSFNEFGGVPVDLQINDSGVTRSFTNPMISSYWLNPSIPQSDGQGIGIDGTETASLRNYLVLSGSNAKTTNYAPQDVTILTLALAEVIKVSTFCARAFGIAYLFNYRNRTYPETLLAAMGIDPADFANNLAIYRVQFNKLMALAAKIPFPADIPIFKKAADLYGSIYCDDDNSALAQTYFFVPNSVWLFNEAYDANGSGLETLKIVNRGAVRPMSLILQDFERMINALITSSSLNVIYSDVMRLVQNGKITQLITFKSIDESFYIVPVYNEEVRDWLHSAIIVGEALDNIDQYYDAQYMNPLTPKNDVSCDAGDNKILYHPQFELPVDSGYDALIDFDHDNVTVEDKVRATRFSQRWTTIADSNTGKIYTNDLAFADEYIVSMAIYDGTTSTPNYTIDSSFELPNSVGRCTALAEIQSKFDWAPITYWYLSTTAIIPIGDLDYYTSIKYPVLKRIYDYEIIHFLQLG